MSSETSLRTVAGVSPANNPLIASTLAFVREHTSLSTTNHSIRALYFALILAQKVPPFQQPSFKLDPTLLAYCELTHDLGWAKTASLISSDKRFEVDSANNALKFLSEHGDLREQTKWQQRELELIWTAIAVHATPSIGHNHPDLHVMLVGIGILADFFGPNMPPPFPPGIITVDEYKAVIKAFPRAGFYTEFPEIMCGFCKNKPETTFDNFVSDFGIMFGTDGKGAGKEEFKAAKDKAGLTNAILGALEGCKEHENE